LVLEMLVYLLFYLFLNLLLISKILNL
jgi:hypothetical protein